MDKIIIGYIIVRGHISHGLEFYGPFKHEDWAMDHAHDAGMDQCVFAPIYEPPPIKDR